MWFSIDARYFLGAFVLTGKSLLIINVIERAVVKPESNKGYYIHDYLSIVATRNNFVAEKILIIYGPNYIFKYNLLLQFNNVFTFLY